MSVGQNIRKIRAFKGFSQKTLAEKAELDQSGLSQIENGHTDPKTETLRKIADVLGVSPGLFFEKDFDIRQKEAG